ncbi:hypothetical protein TNCV_3649801 [Trichonephila clavipes]|nr:hypothetical protein TNCV_3649801 [Trichonephila clavipes]
MGSWLAYHEFESSAAEDPPCRGDHCTLNLSNLKRPLVGLMWTLGRGMPAHVSSSSLDHSSKSRGPSPIALGQLFVQINIITL